MSTVHKHRGGRVSAYLLQVYGADQILVGITGDGAASLPEPQSTPALTFTVSPTRDCAEPAARRAPVNCLTILISSSALLCGIVDVSLCVFLAYLLRG